MLFAVVPARIVQDPRITTTAKAVLAAIACHADRDGLCWPSRQRIARYLSVDARTVSRAFRELAGAGVLQVTPRRDPATGADRSPLLRILFDLPAKAALSAAAQVVGEDPEIGGEGDTSATPPGDTHVYPGVTPMSTRTPSVEQPSPPPPATSFLDLFTDPSHRAAVMALYERSGHPPTFVGEIRAMLQGLRGGTFTPEQIGAACVGILQKRLEPSDTVLRRFAQKARSAGDLPDPEVRTFARDVGAKTIADLEAAVAAEKAARDRAAPVSTPTRRIS